MLFCTTLLCSAVASFFSVADCVQRSSSNHRLRHGRIDLTRPHRSAEVTNEVTAAAGKEIILDCDSAAAFGDVRGQWFHNGELVPVGSGRLQVLKFSRLQISDLRVTDAGLWNCRDPTDTGFDVTNRAVVLKVYAAPESPYILVDDQLSTLDSPINVQENTLVTLTCVSERSMPAPDVRWLLRPVGQAEVNMTGQSRTVTQLAPSEQLYSTRSHLTLNVTREMTGSEVICVTSHHQLQVVQRDTVVLNVQYTPRFSIMRSPEFGSPIIRGMRVNLTCLVDANPPASPIWLQDDKVPRVPNRNGTLLFNPISLEDAGWYKCAATHLRNNVTAYSFYLNVIDDVADGPFRTVETTVGALLSLNCDEDRRYSERPDQGTPCWIKAEQTGRAVATRGHRMHIDGATYQDTGVYSCEMPQISEEENERRVRARSFFVKVTGQPLINHVNLTSDLVLGQPASLRASFCADPPPSRLLWIVGHFSARAGDTVGDIIAYNITDGGYNSCYTASLFIAAVRPEMVGDVSVIVINARGMDHWNRSVSVAQPSHVTGGWANRRAAPGGSWTAVGVIFALAARGFLPSVLL